MKRVGMIAFTRRGCRLACDLAMQLSNDPAYAGAVFNVSGPKRFADECEVQAYPSLGKWTARHFASDDVLVYVGACGIAVRAIAPYLRDKFTDPAVVSVDEAGAFAIPLLSGHVGGANDVARDVARVLGGQAAVSTATDVNGLFAVDEWAARHGMVIVERTLAKQISARLLEGGPVGFWTDLENVPNVPDGVVVDDADLGFAVSVDDACQPFARTLHLVPRIAVVGVGCRRGTDPAVLEHAVDAALGVANTSRFAVCTLASIDVKQDEPAIIQLATSRGWDMRFFTAEELAAVPGDFAASDFVRKTVGVDNVCERSAVAAGGKLISGKQSGDGVTVAIALRDIR